MWVGKGRSTRVHSPSHAHLGLRSARGATSKSVILLGQLHLGYTVHVAKEDGLWKLKSESNNTNYGWQ